jgi:hypothetical protein
MLGRRRLAAVALMLILGACGDGEAPEPELPTRTPDGRIIVRGHGLVYAIRPPPGWIARSVRGADRSTHSTLTVADISPPDGSPVSISGQMRTKDRDFHSIDSWIEHVTRIRRARDPAFTLWRAGPVPVRGGRPSEMVVLQNSEPAAGSGSTIDHEAVVLIEEPDAIAEIFLTTKTKGLLDQNIATLRAVAASYGPAV